MPICYRRLALKIAAGISCFLFLNYIILQSYKKGNCNLPLIAQRLAENPTGPAVPQLDPSGTRCPPGFYTTEELRPHLQRPPQDSGAPGAHGEAFVPSSLSPEELDEKLRGFVNNQFDQFVSDRISLQRDLGEDTRHPDCLEQRFWRCPGLPTTTVIIVFHNEAWSALLRTVYSVLHTAPAALLTEILLVDDASTEDHLKSRLDEYVKQLKIVRVLRQRERKGLVSARLLGAQSAQGEVLTFLDSHCECFTGWLEPLLARVAEEPTAVVSPRIVKINKDNLEFSKPLPEVKYSRRGNFDWRLTFKWEHIPKAEMDRRRNETSPIRTPTFAGGLFSVSKSYFERIGTYDDQMEFWGGENLEMSFRVWQCGGQLEIIPCSIVGHIFRKKNPHVFPNSPAIVTRNLVRAAEVWLDEFKWIFYRMDRKAALIYKENSFGNVTERHELRQRLKCKDFSWYLDNIFTEAYVPEIYGQLENIGLKCWLDVERTKKQGKRGAPKLICGKSFGAQYFDYTRQHEVQLNPETEMCLHATPGKSLVSVQPCRSKEKTLTAAPEQEWIFTQTNQLKNPSSGKCLTVEEGQVIVMKCLSTKLSHSWTLI